MALTEYHTKKENQNHLENKPYCWVKPGFYLIVCGTSHCSQSLEQQFQLHNPANCRSDLLMTKWKPGFTQRTTEDNCFGYGKCYACC